MRKGRILFVVNDPGFFVSHRLPVAEAAREDGYDVQVATMDGTAVEAIEKLGFVHHKIPLTRSGLNPLAEVRILYFLWILFRKLRPDLVHLVTVKPVVYGGIVARFSKCPAVVSAISGLGFLFIERSGMKAQMIRFLVLLLYRAALGHPNQRIIFQNPSDMNAISNAIGIEEKKLSLIRGSGVDLTVFQRQPEKEVTTVVVMASRLLKDKGVQEFVEAARILKSKNVDAQFRLIGEPDYGNPESVTSDELKVWQTEGVVECLGHRADIADLFANAHLVVLPSYREGLPKVLVEAAACGRAVVTTDTPGCRDAIEPGITGLLVPARDSHNLAAAIQTLIEDPDRRQQMGKKGRELAEREYAIEKIAREHLDIYQSLLKVS